MELGPWLLYLHVLGAIVAFGPTFAFPIYGAAGGREPQHANFMVRATHLVASRLVVPLALLQGVTGVGLILAFQFDLLNTRWLLSAIVLYLIALYVAIGLNLPNASRIIELTSAPPAPGSGPSPELLSRIAATRRYGIALSILIVVIVSLMVVKPTF
jgi:hypothetical protein